MCISLELSVTHSGYRNFWENNNVVGAMFCLYSIGAFPLYARGACMVKAQLLTAALCFEAKLFSSTPHNKAYTRMHHRHKGPHQKGIIKNILLVQRRAGILSLSK